MIGRDIIITVTQPVHSAEHPVENGNCKSLLNTTIILSPTQRYLIPGNQLSTHHYYLVIR